MQKGLSALTCALALGVSAYAGAAPAADGANADFADQQAKRSYALGMDIGSSIQGMPIDIQLDELLAGVRDTLGGDATKLSQQQKKAVLQDFYRQIRRAQLEQAAQQAKANLQASKAFLAENKTKDGVKVTASGLQYKVLAEGDGPQPDINDTVTVHYTGKLIDGTVFDSSRKRGQPATFPVNGVIPGWTEALQMMHEGARYKLFIPPKLAYGVRGAGGKIGPNQALIFEVELLKVNTGNEGTSE